MLNYVTSHPVNRLAYAIVQMATVEMGERKKQSMTDRLDMLGKAFKLQREKPKEVNDDVLNAIAGQNVVAGSDTTAITMRTIIYHLLKNPEYMARLRAEVEKNRAQGRLSNPVTFEQARQMPYLQACISEGLRIHPAIGMTLPRVVPAGGIQIQGYYLPEGVCRSRAEGSSLTADRRRPSLVSARG